MFTFRRKAPAPPDQKPGPVHLLHIGKTGGTALKAALRPYRGKAGIQFHGHHTKLAHIPHGERVVFFVRDPISRFVSAFYSRFRQGQPRHNVPWNADEEAAFSFFQTADQLAAALSSPDRAVRKQAKAAMLGIRHVKTSYTDWFGSNRAFRSRLPDVLLVGIQEDLEADFERLKLLLGIPAEVALPTDDRLSHRSPAQFDKSLSPVGEANLRRWYAKDLHFYAWCKELRRDRLSAGR